MKMSATYSNPWVPPLQVIVSHWGRANFSSLSVEEAEGLVKQLAVAIAQCKRDPEELKTKCTTQP